MQQGAGEGFIGAEGITRGDEDCIAKGRIGCAAPIGIALVHRAAGGEDEVVRDGRRAVALMLGERWCGDSLNLLGVEDVPVTDAAEVVAFHLVLARLLVLLLDGELPPLLDERGLRAFLEVPSAVANLIEGTPSVVLETAHVSRETEMEAIAALIHCAGHGVMRAEGGKVGFHPAQPVALHVLDDFIHHTGALFLYDFDGFRLLLLFHGSPFCNLSMQTLYQGGVFGLPCGFSVC